MCQGRTPKVKYLVHRIFSSGQWVQYLAMFVMRSPNCTETRCDSSDSSSLAAALRTAAFSWSGTLDHSLDPRVLRHELPTAFLANMEATNLIACIMKAQSQADAHI